MHGTAAVHDLSPGFRSFWAVCLADTGCRPCRRNASENPAGIETHHSAIRSVDSQSGRNASENPAGIETFCIIHTSSPGGWVATHQKTQQGLKRTFLTGVIANLNVATHQKTQQGLKPVYDGLILESARSQRIRKPSRD